MTDVQIRMSITLLSLNYAFAAQSRVYHTTLNRYGYNYHYYYCIATDAGRLLQCDVAVWYL